MADSSFLQFSMWKKVTTEAQRSVLRSLLAMYDAVVQISIPKTTGTPIRVVLCGGAAQRAVYLVNQDGTTKVVELVDFPPPKTTTVIQQSEPIQELSYGESDDVIEEDDIQEIEPTRALVTTEEHRALQVIMSSLSAILSPQVSIEEAADLMLTFLDNAQFDVAKQITPQEANALRQARRFETLRRLREVASYAEAKMLAREIENPTTWTDSAGEYHELIGDPNIGPRISGRTRMIANFEKVGQTILESYGIDMSKISRIKDERPSVLCELQSAIQHIINETPPNERREKLIQAVEICSRPGAHRELQRLFYRHRWPLIPTTVTNDGIGVRVEMLIESHEQWLDQVRPRLDTIIEETELHTPGVSPRAVLDVINGKRDPRWLLRLAVLARSDLAKIVSIFEKHPNSALDIAVDISPLFPEYTETRIRQIVNELCSLGVLEKDVIFYRINHTVWRTDNKQS